MKGITHKQAVKWIHRRQDGLLDVNRHVLLDEHLQACDSCRAYSEEMASFSSVLEREFHTRWEGAPGPSDKLIERVMTQAPAIPGSQRASMFLRLAGSVAVLLVMGLVINFLVSQLQESSPGAAVTETVGRVPPPEKRLLAFASSQDGNSEIYTMHADGSGLTNITDHPANDGSPFWSPDGRKIAFVSDRDGSLQIYLMDADGSNVTRLTHDPGSRDAFDLNGKTPWSPDGSRLIYSSQPVGEREYYLLVMDLASQSTTKLTNEPGLYLRPSWSPDGSHIAFTTQPGGIPQDLFVVRSDGSGLVKLTENLPAGEFYMSGYTWSENGSLYFTTNKNVQNFQDATYFATVYEASPDGSLTVADGATDQQIVDWWNGITVLKPEEPRLTWQRPDGSESSLDLCPDGGHVLAYSHQRSTSGNLAFGSLCSKNGWMLYWANPEGTVTNELLDQPLPDVYDSLFWLTWSPDDNFLTFVALDMDQPGISDLYVIDVAEARKDPTVQPLKIENGSSPSWQPVSDNATDEEPPTPAPTQISDPGRILAFASATQDENADIYSMRADGSEMKNLTHHPAWDASPKWSPDGKGIAFESDRDGSRQVYLMDADGSRVIQVTSGEMFHRFNDDYSDPWSPAGDRLIVAESEPYDRSERAPAQEWSLYVVDIAGGNKTLLTEAPGFYGPATWSPDGQSIAFVASEGSGERQVTRVYVVPADGGDLTDISKLLPADENLAGKYHWASDGRSIFLIAYSHLDEGSDRWKAYKADLDDGSLTEMATSSSLMDDWWADTAFINDHGSGSPLTWLHPDGTYTTLDPLESCEIPDPNDYQYGVFPVRSARGHLAIAITCPNYDVWLYRADPEGRVIQRLLDAPLSMGQGSVSGMVWSPDDQFIALSVDTESSGLSMYILNMEAALREPSLRPLQVTVSSGTSRQYWSPDWQPVP